MADIMLYFV